MVNGYIENLITETEEELLRLQRQMAELLDDLKYSQEKQEKLQREKNKDTNIFSPRSMTSDMDGKLEKAKEEVRVNNQRIEYIRERIEISTKKKMEYKTLLHEFQKRNEENKDETSNYMQEENDLENMHDFLNKIYKRTELCLALLNGDKNRCRNELKCLKSDIKMFAEKIENK